MRVGVPLSVGEWTLIQLLWGRDSVALQVGTVLVCIDHETKCTRSCERELPVVGLVDPEEHLSRSYETLGRSKTDTAGFLPQGNPIAQKKLGPTSEERELNAEPIDDEFEDLDQLHGSRVWVYVVIESEPGG